IHNLIAIQSRQTAFFHFKESLVLHHCPSHSLAANHHRIEMICQTPAIHPFHLCRKPMNCAGNIGGIWRKYPSCNHRRALTVYAGYLTPGDQCTRSEEHTSELQSRENLVC